MSVYVGIDVHRKRSQVAVVSEDGTVELNKNVVNGSEPMLRLIGDLPSGTPVAFEAAFGWGWLVQLLEDYGFEPHMVHPLRCKAIASARLKNDKVDAAILAQLLRADLLPEAWIAPPQVRQLRALLRHRASLVRVGTQQRNRIHAVAADHGYDRSASYWTGPGRGWLAEPGPAAGVAGDRYGLPGGDRWPGPGDRPDRRRAAPARQRRPAGQGAPDAARGRGVHRAGHGGRDRRHHPVRQRP
jgi:transposase